MAAKDAVVLVTGGSGYLALHCVRQCLEAGYRVRASVRSLTNEDKCRPLKELVPSEQERLELVEADLLEPSSWTRAVEGVTYILHVASPFPAKTPTDENVLIKPAVDGTLNTERAIEVLKAAAKTKGHVKRVVLTSSVAAIGFGYLSEPGKVFTEADWSRTEAVDCAAYPKSKTLAEKAAWDFVSQLKADEVFELVAINPGFIVGPLLGSCECSSADVIKRFMVPDLPLIPRVKMEYVDVRDVAKAHVIAMTAPRAKGERIILVSHVGWFKEMCEMLKKEFGQYGYKPVTAEAPKFLLKLASLFDPMVRTIYPRVGFDFTMDNSKMRSLLGIEPIPIETSLRDMGHSLIQRGFVPRKPNYVPPQST